MGDFAISAEILAHLEFEVSHVYHCVASPYLLTTVLKYQGTLGGMLCHSCLIKLLNSPESSLLYFAFLICQMFSVGERSELQVGQSSTQTVLVQTHAAVTDAVSGFKKKLHLDKRMFL